MIENRLARQLFLSLILLIVLVRFATFAEIGGVEEQKPAGPFLKDEPAPLPGKNFKKFDLEPPWFIIQQRLNWSESKEACLKFDSNLAVLPTIAMAHQLVDSIYDKSEKGSVIDKAKPRTIEFGPSRRYWIGLSDEGSEKNWTWVGLDTQLDYKFWYNGQPDHFNENKKAEHCGSLWNPGYFAETNNKHTFNDAPCSKKYYPICDSTKDLKSYLKSAN